MRTTGADSTPVSARRPRGYLLAQQPRDSPMELAFKTGLAVTPGPPELSVSVARGRGPRAWLPRTVTIWLGFEAPSRPRPAMFPGLGRDESPPAFAGTVPEANCGVFVSEQCHRWSTPSHGGGLSTRTRRESPPPGGRARNSSRPVRRKVVG